MTPVPLPPGGPGSPSRLVQRGLALATLVGALALSGCSGSGTVGANGSTATVSATASGSSTGDSSVDCDLSGCTVTLQRGVDAGVSVLGLEMRLTGVTGDQATLQVGSQKVTVPLNGQGSTEVAGLSMTVQSTKGSAVVLRVTRT